MHTLDLNKQLSHNSFDESSIMSREYYNLCCIYCNPYVHLSFICYMTNVTLYNNIILVGWQEALMNVIYDIYPADPPPVKAKSRREGNNEL